ncbi:MAG: hypothetical protein ACTIKE_12220 [Sphingobacterium sp.]
MPKKKLHIKFVALLIGLCVWGGPLRAQITIQIPQANIQSGTAYNQDFSAGRFVSVLGLVPSFRINANTANFSNASSGLTVPLNRANISLLRIGSVAVLGGGTEQPLSTAPATLYAAVASLLSGDISARARIPVVGFPWVAGVYTSNITFSLAGINLGAIIPGSQDFNINVPGFISLQSAIGAIRIPVNNLNSYRAVGGVSANKVTTLSTTVPYIPSVRVGTAQFNFNTTLPYNETPLSPVSAVRVGLANEPSATPVSLSASNQALTGATGIGVTTNIQSLTNTYSINAAQLNAHFLQAGTYSVPLTYTWNKLSSAYPSGTVQAIGGGTLEVIVEDLAEIVAVQQTVSVDFDDVNDYKNGVIRDVAGQLRISKTTPYSLTVRANSSAFTSGINSIPLSVLRIGPTANQVGMTTVTLSTSAQQLIGNANPVIDRDINLRFSIPASQTQHLFGKPPGTYAADIIFGIVAP